MKLPKFIYERILRKNTSLGDNDALPQESEDFFELKLAQDRFKEVCDEVSGIVDLKSLDERKTANLLGSLIKQCKEIEEPFKDNLKKICENVISNLFVIPDEIININCELVDIVKPQHSFRITPESADNRKFKFKNIADIGEGGKAINKRRMIDALIQGASYDMLLEGDLFVDEVSKLDERLPKLYEQIIKLNDLLLFLKEENITDDNPMQGGYVEVELGNRDTKTDINAQGTIFPFLLFETIRGFFELFASHGLPSDDSKAMYVISQADILVAEAWDLRLGVGMWRILTEKLDDTKYLPYFFRDLCELHTEEFNEFLREVFADTEEGERNLMNLTNHAKHEYEMDDFENAIQQKNAQNGVLNDNYISVAELDDYVLDDTDDEDDADVIEEEPY